MIHYPDKTLSGETDDGLDLTALIDVVFTLIVFLILTMGTSQVMTEINLSSSQKPLKSDTDTEQSIIIEVGHAPRFWKLGDLETREFTRFQEVFLSQHKDHRDREVVLALEKTLPVEELVALMDFLSLHQFSKIQIVNQWAP